MTDPARIAASLSPAQRKALLWLPADQNMARNGSARGAPYRSSLLVLRNSGPLALEATIRSGWWHLTPLGQQVRAHIAAAERDTR